MPNIEIITKAMKALTPLAALLGYNLSPEHIEAIAYIIGGLLTLAYSTEAWVKSRNGVK
jgi:hypothetical protein